MIPLSQQGLMCLNETSFNIDECFSHMPSFVSGFKEGSLGTLRKSRLMNRSLYPRSNQRCCSAYNELTCPQQDSGLVKPSDQYQLSGGFSLCTRGTQQRKWFSLKQLDSVSSKWAEMQAMAISHHKYQHCSALSKHRFIGQVCVNVCLGQSSFKKHARTLKTSQPRPRKLSARKEAAMCCNVTHEIIVARARKHSH